MRSQLSPPTLARRRSWSDVDRVDGGHLEESRADGSDGGGGRGLEARVIYRDINLSRFRDPDEHKIRIEYGTGGFVHVYRGRQEWCFNTSRSQTLQEIRLWEQLRDEWLQQTMEGL